MGKKQCLRHVWSLLLRAYKFRSNLHGKKQIPRNIIFNHFTLTALWYIQTTFCGNETSHVYRVKSQKHQNKVYLHCDICLGTHSTPTCWNPEPPGTFKNPVTHGVCDQSTDQLVQQTNMNSITITIHCYILWMAPAFITMVTTGLFCDLPTKKRLCHPGKVTLWEETQQIHTIHHIPFSWLHYISPRHLRW